MEETVRIGIVGTSGYTTWSHLPYLQSHSQSQIVAICGRNHERAAKVAGQYGIPKVYIDYNQMIEDGGLDALVIATPDHLHYPIAMAALNAGLHVLCEKPLAKTAQQSREMYDTAESSGLVHMTMFTWRWVPFYRQILELISSGYLGQVQSVSMRWPMAIGIEPSYLWRTDMAFGSGALADLGAHIFDLARLFAGGVQRVAAHLTTRIHRPHPDGLIYEAANDTASVLLEFDQGAQGILEMTYAAILGEGAPGELHVELQGSEATIRTYANLSSSYLLGAYKGEKNFKPLPVDERFTGGLNPNLPFADRFFPLFTTQSIGDRQFIDAILGKTQVWPTFYDGWKACQLIDAAFESHRRGCFVAVDEGKAH